MDAVQLAYQNQYVIAQKELIGQFTEQLTSALAQAKMNGEQLKIAAGRIEELEGELAEIEEKHLKELDDQRQKYQAEINSANEYASSKKSEIIELKQRINVLQAQVGDGSTDNDKTAK